MQRSSVAIVILAWNGRKDTIECLESISRLDAKPATIIFCDNASTDGTKETVLEWAAGTFGRTGIAALKGPSPPPTGSFPHSLVYIENPSNLGYAAGNNVGIRFVLSQKKHDFIWILNNDTVVEPDSLSALVRCAAGESDAGIFGSTVVFADRPDVVQCAGGCAYNPLTTVFTAAFGGRLREDALSAPEGPRLDYIYGASMFIRREVFEKCGLLNEDYFLYYEEIDFCTRAKAAGFGLSWCRESVVRHKGGAPVGTYLAEDRGKLIFANYHENLSTLKYTKRFHPWLLPFSMTYRFFGKIWKVGRRGEWFLVKPLFAAYRDFLRELKAES